MSNISSSTISKTTEQENEVLARRFHMEIFQKAKFSVADEILTPDFVLHNPVLPVELTKGPEGVKRFASGVVDSCPGYQITHHETISKGDKVLIRWTFTGIPKKNFLGVSASEKPIIISGFDLFRISEDGKLAEMWQQWNIGSWR
ncbi:MAG TPA: ester cyclase [Nitrososphaeraceae archaeon]|jgi:predicted SnoaL-like aldol condensation-catalyzing enzyme|nr:ester cyclase [Nitrososphaeraceae archaeon]